MAHGVNSVMKRTVTSVNNNSCKVEGAKGIGSRRIFAPHFKLQVLDSYRNDADCKGNQRATARKYGIHRRQIQKWLQAENALRNSVAANKELGKAAAACDQQSEVALNGSRQRDDESRVPALTDPLPGPPTPLVLDFSTHNRCPSPHSPLPIDLSLKRPTSNGAPVCCAPCTPPTPTLPSSLTPHPDVWDLSIKNLKRKCSDDTSSSSDATSPKPVKLFKPYLDALKDDPPEPAYVKLEPCCSAAMVSTCEGFYYNNNNVCDEYNTYTLHELQPKTYYYYPPYSGEYEIGACCYEDISYGQTLAPLKQRQSYSLDFKLSAIDCYYQDEICKGNQRAVASKYNIHRRQVQKWLKQAEELRLRNESMKQIHAVR